MYVEGNGDEYTCMMFAVQKGPEMKYNCNKKAGEKDQRHVRSQQKQCATSPETSILTTKTLRGKDQRQVCSQQKR